jgi:hypothetical protein
MKVCNACGEEKQADEFYRCNYGKSLMGSCKDCWKARVILRRRTNPAVQEYERERAKAPHRRAKSKRLVANWRKTFPDKYAALTALDNAVRDKKVTPGNCVDCNTDKNVFGIHLDYSKPLEVIWRCALCHHRGPLPRRPGRNDDDRHRYIQQQGTPRMKLWAKTDEYSEGKFLVVRRDGSVPHWPHFVIGARDPAAPVALRAYAAACSAMCLDTEFVGSIDELAEDFERYRAEQGDGDADAPPHRTDDPDVIAAMRGDDVTISVRRDRKNVVKDKAPPLAKALQDVRRDLWVDYCLQMGRTDTDPRPFDARPHIRIIDEALRA